MSRTPVILVGIPLVALLTLGLIGCDSSASDLSPPTLLDPVTDLHPMPVTIGAAGQPGEGSLTMVRAARFEPGGGGVVVLDAHPPHIKRYNVTGEPVMSFGRSGEGPGEVSVPLSLGVERDGSILVLSFDGIRRLGPSGDELARHRLAGMQPASLGVICDSPVIYGFGAGNDGTHRTIVVALDWEAGMMTDVWKGSSAATVRQGDRQVAGGSKGGVVRADLGEVRELLSFDCGEGGQVAIRRTQPLEGVQGEAQAEGTSRIATGARGPAGVVLVGTESIVADVIVGNPIVTELTLRAEAGPATVLRLRGMLVLEDYYEGRVLLSTQINQEPVLLIVEEEALLNAFREHGIEIGAPL